MNIISNKKKTDKLCSKILQIVNTFVSSEHFRPHSVTRELNNTLKKIFNHKGNY